MQAFYATIAPSGTGGRRGDGQGSCALDAARPCIVTRGRDLVTVNNFSDGLANPVLGYVVSCLGAFLGLRCVTRASYYQGRARARWLAIAATAIGATGIWAMHFIAMLGFAIPGQDILENVSLRLATMVIGM